MRVADRRVFHRVDVDLEISLQEDASNFTARCMNLCPGGLLIHTFRTLVPGFGLLVEFDLPASRVLAQGIVQWSREATERSMPGYGIAFTELTRFDRTLIETFCATHSPDGYPSLRVSDRRLAG